MSKENAKIILTVPIELKNELQKLAKEDNRSLSNYIVTILQQSVKG